MGELSADRAQEELLISADSHVIELPDLWEKGLPRSFSERAPRVYFDERRESWMFGCAEVPPQAVGGLFMAGRRPEEIGKFPYWLGQCDKAFERHRSTAPLTLKKRPSEYFQRQVYATFFNDQVGCRLLSWWGMDNCMWSNDYPHQNSTWPRSREVIARDLGSLPAGDRAKLVRLNVARLYDLKLPLH